MKLRAAKPSPESFQTHRIVKTDPHARAESEFRFPLSCGYIFLIYFDRFHRRTVGFPHLATTYEK